MSDETVSFYYTREWQLEKALREIRDKLGLRNRIDAFCLTSGLQQELLKIIDEGLRR